MGLFRSFLATLVLALVALVAISPVSTNASVVQDRKFAKLQSMALENKGIVELDSALFDEFVSTPRNYSIVILFTAMGPQFQCTPCKQFEPEFKLVASGWSRLPEKSKLFYARLDFEVGQMVFQKLGMNTAPTVMLLSPAKSESNQSPPSRYDFATQGMHADGFTTWIKTQTGFHVPVRRPINYVVLGVKVSGGLGVLAFLFGAYLNADKISIRRYIWSAVSLLTIFVMISGHMWNHIRRPAYNIPGR
ncbi:oligosaccharyl transferase subunit ost3/OST6, partial [Lunasporangiospora selenospora]